MMVEAPAPEPLRRILVVKLADLGDALLATPAIRALRARYPNTRIDALGAPAAVEVFRRCPAIDGVISFPKRLFDEPAQLIHPTRQLQLARLARQIRAGRYDALVLLHHLATGFGVTKFRALCLASGATIRAGLDNGRGSFLTHRAIDFGYDARSELDYGLDVVRTLGATTDDRRPAIVVPDSADDEARAMLQSEGVNGPYLVIHPGVGSYSPARAWHPVRLGEVGRTLRDRLGLDIVLIGTAVDEEAARVVAESCQAYSLVGATSIDQLSAVLRGASLAIGSDSGVMHLASAMGTPLIAVFGPSNPTAWCPYGALEVRSGNVPDPPPRAALVRSGIPCSPCFYRGFELGRRSGCSLRTCLDEVRAEHVSRLALAMLGHRR